MKFTISTQYIAHFALESTLLLWYTIYKPYSMEKEIGA